jgi:hypothetical protein
MIQVAVDPSMPGNIKSMSTTSGKFRLVRSIASSPEAASPFTTNSVDDDRYARNPLRTTT